VRLQRLSLDRKGLVTQAKDCDPSNNLLDPLFVLAGERGRARAIAIAPPRRRRPPRRSASEARAGVERRRRRPPRRSASEARAPATQPPGAIDIAASATGRSTKRGSRRLFDGSQSFACVTRPFLSSERRCRRIDLPSKTHEVQTGFVSRRVPWLCFVFAFWYS
jgi:hypothetical protein